MRKIWQKPKLVVLVRGRPEEHVLGACKAAQTAGDPSNTDANCIENAVYCQACDVMNGS